MKWDEWSQTGKWPDGVQVACGSSGPGISWSVYSNDFRFSLTHIDKQACVSRDVCLHVRLRRQVPGKGLPEQKKDLF